MLELATLQHDEQDHGFYGFVTGQSTMVFMDDPLTNLPAFHMV
jgi:hypothetical protein